MSWKHFLIALLVFAGRNAAAQVIPVAIQPPQKTPAKLVAKILVKPVYVPQKANTGIVKIFPNADCDIYIDGEYKGEVTSGNLLRLSLSKGTYIIKAVAKNNREATITRYTLDRTDSEQLVEIKLKNEAGGSKENRPRETVATTSQPYQQPEPEGYAPPPTESQIAIAQKNLNKGVEQYSSGQYELAYQSFDAYRKILPEDTTAVYYTAIAAYNAQNYAAAIKNYKKLTTIKFSKQPDIYRDLSGIYLITKDTLNAYDIAAQGVERFPNSIELRKRVIEIDLQRGNGQQTLPNIQTAISYSPNDKYLYYYAGLVYSGQGDQSAALLKTATGEPLKEKYRREKRLAYGNATSMYRKALLIDGNYFDVNLNLGYVLLSDGIDIYNAANLLPASVPQAQYDSEMARAKKAFDLAKPYLLKAVELNPRSVDALSNLRTYYLGTRNPTEAAAIKARIDALN